MPSSCLEMKPLPSRSKTLKASRISVGGAEQAGTSLLSSDTLLPGPPGSPSLEPEPSTANPPEPAGLVRALAGGPEVRNSAAPGSLGRARSRGVPGPQQGCHLPQGLLLVRQAPTASPGILTTTPCGRSHGSHYAGEEARRRLPTLRSFHPHSPLSRSCAPPHPPARWLRLSSSTLANTLLTTREAAQQGWQLNADCLGSPRFAGKGRLDRRVPASLGRLRCGGRSLRSGIQRGRQA